MNVKNEIETRVSDELAPVFLDVVDESHMHNVPPGAQSHFKLTVVSEQFAEKRLIARHRILNGLCADLLAGPIHALALHTYTPQEWEARGETIMTSPACRGGDKS